MMKAYISGSWTDWCSNLTRYVIGEMDVECKAYDEVLKKYVGLKAADSLTNFVSGSTILFAEVSTAGYVGGICQASISREGWIHVNSDVETIVHIRAVMLYK